MKRNIVIIDGHPDPDNGRLCHALVDAYAQGVIQAGHDLKIIRVAELEIPILRTKKDFEEGEPSPSIKRVQDATRGADHLLLVYPLWLGTMPALLKALLEQVFRPQFTVGASEPNVTGHRNRKGMSARIVITMGMPVFFYRWYFRAHSLKNLERNILKFCGIKPVKQTLFGMVESVKDSKRRRWLKVMYDLGVRDGR